MVGFVGNGDGVTVTSIGVDVGTGVGETVFETGVSLGDKVVFSRQATMRSRKSNKKRYVTILFIIDISFYVQIQIYRNCLIENTIRLLKQILIRLHPLEHQLHALFEINFRFPAEFVFGFA